MLAIEAGSSAGVKSINILWKIPPSPVVGTGSTNYNLAIISRITMEVARVPK